MGIRLWEEDGAVVAWSWLKRGAVPGQLEHDVHRRTVGELLDEILAEPDAARVAFAFEDDPERAGQRSRGTASSVSRRTAMHYNWCATSGEPPEPPPLPDGFRFRTVARRRPRLSASRSTARSGRAPTGPRA